MSNTYKKEKLRNGFRLKPYQKDLLCIVAPKFKPEKYRSRTQAYKEELKNANRSFKKGKRQELKRQLQDELEELGY